MQKTMLMRKDVLKNFNFHYIQDYSQKSVSFHNVYISYGHNFSMGSNIGIMYWNFNPHKTVHLKT